MNRNEEIAKLKNSLIERIKLEDDSRYVNLSSDEVMKIIIDSSLKGKYVLWVLREYLKGNIQRFEDMSRVKQALTLFKNNLSKLTEQQKRLSKLSFQELESLVEPYQDVLTQNEIKRINKEKIWAEIDIIYEGPEGRIYAPKTVQASIFLGQGTKWCTAATKNNMFNYYDSQGPLYIFVTNDKDKNGREFKYQLHFETSQFMDIEDVSVDIKRFNDVTGLISILVNNLSLEQKIKHYLECIKLPSLLFNEKEPDEFTKKLMIEKFKLTGDSNLLYSISNYFFDYDFWKATVSMDANRYFRYVPKKLVTKDFCETAVKQNGEALRYVPQELKTKELCKLAVEQNGHALEYVPDNLKTYEMCEIAVKNGCLLGHVPKEFLTYELCKLTVQKNNLSLRFIPKEFMTPEIYELAVTYDPISLNSVPNELKSKKICEIVVKKSPVFLEKIPKEYRTQEMYELSLESNGFLFFPKHLITNELCLKYLKKDGMYLRSIPLDMKTKEMCEIAVKQNGMALEHVPLALRTQEIYKMALEQNGIALRDFPEELRTPEFCEQAVRQNGKALYYVPNNLITQELCEIAIETNAEAFMYVPTKFTTPDICKKAIQKDIRNLNHIPKCDWGHKLIKETIVEFFSGVDPNYTFEKILEDILFFKKKEIENKFELNQSIFKKYYIELKINEFISEFENKNTFAK